MTNELPDVTGGAFNDDIANDPHSVYYRQSIGAPPRNWIEFKKALFVLMTKQIKTVPIEPKNYRHLRRTEGESPEFTVPVITYTLIRAYPSSTPGYHDRSERQASPNIEGAKVRVRDLQVSYTLQFDCWAEGADEADVVLQRVMDFFLRGGAKLKNIGVARFRWLETLTDVYIEAMGFPYSVRSCRFELVINHKEGELIPEIGSIILSTPLVELPERLE